MGCGLSDLREDNVSLEFLILLKKSDYKKTFSCMSKMHKIKHIIRKLPGNVNIDQISKTTKQIKGLNVPYVVYIKLPKEHIYVTSDVWEFEYFNSQVMELIGIFTALGANEISFNAQKGNIEVNVIEAGLNAKIPNINVSIEGHRENEHKEQSKFSGHIQINNVKKIKYDSVSEFIDKNKLYYAKFYPEWKSLIGYKLTTDTSKIDFEYTFHKGFHCQTKVGAKLELAGVICGFANTKMEDVTLKFCVNFTHPGYQFINRCHSSISEHKNNFEIDNEIDETICKIKKTKED